MLKYFLITCSLVKVVQLFDQRYFEISGGYSLVNVKHQLVDVSFLECAKKCLEYARDGSCNMAGYDRAAKSCQISADQATTTALDNNSLVFKPIVICSTPPAPVNGEVEVSDDLLSANFSCNSGYILNGTTTMQCVNGSWAGDFPSCYAEPVCSTPPAPVNGEVEVSDDLQSANFSCNSGFILNGTTTMQCVDGSWAGAFPSCYAEPGCPPNPPIPVNGDHIDNITGYNHYDTAVVVCQTGYVPSSPSIQCQTDGTWETATCIFDCGQTLGSVHPNVDVTYSGGSTSGATALVTCSFGYRSDGMTSWSFFCDPGMQSWMPSTTNPDCVWELMFRGTAENGYNVTSAFLFGSPLDGVTTEPGCADVYNTSCNLHYRNPKVDNWGTLSIAEVKYEMYDTTSTVMEVTFDGTGSTVNSWFSTSTVVSYPWSVPSLSGSWWDLNGSTDIAQGRSFRMTNGYELGAVACADHYYTVIFYPPGWTCAYDDFAAFPKFTYTTNPSGAVYSTDPFQTARALGIWVRYA